MASWFLYVSFATFDDLVTDQAKKVLVLSIVTPKAVEGLKDSLPLYHAYFLTTMPRAPTGKTQQPFSSFSLTLVSGVALSFVLLELPFLSCPFLFVSQSLSPTPRLMSPRST